jgi:hypothetical protein
MRAARPCEDGGAGTHLDWLPVDGHDPAAADDVIDLVLVLLVIADGRSRLQRALPEHHPQLRRVLEERIADRLTATVVSAGLFARHFGVAFEHVASGEFLGWEQAAGRLPWPAGLRPAAACRLGQRHRKNHDYKSNRCAPHH